MATRKAEVLFIGDAASIVRAASQSEQAVGKATSGISKHHATIGNSFTSMTKKIAGAAIGFGAAYAGIAGAEKAISATEELAHETLLLSKNFGLSTKAASEWSAVAESRGLAANKLTMGFKTLSTQIVAGTAGTKASKAAFDELGISTSELKAHGNDLQMMLGLVSDGLAKLPPGTQKSALEAKLFGRSWQSLAPLLRDGSKAMNDQLGLADKYGATFSNKGAKGLEDMIQAQRESKLATLGLQVAFGTMLAPALTKVIEAVTGFIAGIRNGTGAGGQFRDVIQKIIDVIAPAVGWFVKHKDITLALAAAIGTMVIAVQAVTTATALWTAVSEANPWVILGTAVVALAAGLVVLNAKTHIITDAFKTLKGVFADVVSWIKGAVNDVLTSVGNAWHSLSSTTTNVWNGIRDFIVGIVTGIKNTVTGTATAIHDGVLNSWHAIEDGTHNVWNAVTGFLSGTWHDIKSTASDIWGNISDAITGSIHDAIGSVKKMVNDVTDWLSGAWKGISGGVVSFAGDLKSGITSAFGSAVNAVIGFVNDIISVIDVIPGVNVGKVKPIDTGQSSTGGGISKTGGGKVPGLAVGGKVNSPMYMVGEEAPTHPEYILATNPAYRQRNIGLWQAAGHSLGIPGFAGGGILGGIGSAIGDVGSTLGNAAGSVVGILGGGAKFLLDKLPGASVLPSWLAGLAGSLLGSATKYIKDKVSGFLGSLIGGGGGGGPVKAQIASSLGSMGWNKIAIAGAIGNASQESSLSPAIDGGGAAGLWQWTPGSKLFDWAAAHGLPWQAVATQAMKLNADMGGPGSMNLMRSPAAAATYMMNSFERPLASAANLPNRIAQANLAYSQGFAKGGVVGYGGARAMGGPVAAGYAYTVGERGAETFIPNRSGTIVPHGGGGVYIGKAYFSGTRAAKAMADRLAYKARIGAA
jgi:hypothetical protein